MIDHLDGARKESRTIAVIFGNRHSDLSCNSFRHYINGELHQIHLIPLIVTHMHDTVQISVYSE